MIDPPKGHRWVTLPVDDELVHVKLPRYGDGDEVTVLTSAGYVEQGTVDMSNGWCVRGEDDEPISLAAIAVPVPTYEPRYPITPVRLDPRDKERFQAAASASGLSLSDWIREACYWFARVPAEERAHEDGRKAKTA